MQNNYLSLGSVQLLKVLDLFFSSKGADSLLDVNPETEQQDLLMLMQAKIASLTLHNKELQDKLQVGYFVLV